VLDATGQLVDFSFAYLNPAAQRLLGLPAQPTVTYRQQFTEPEAGFSFHYAAYLAGGEPRHLAANYHQPGAYDAYFRLAAQRVGELLLVSFTASTEQEHHEVEQALRESQARERAARAEAETQRQRFYEVLQQLPAQVATYTGPDHVFTFVNPRFESFLPAAAVLGRLVREASAGAVSEALFALLDRVYTTGEVIQAYEVEVQLAPHQPGNATPLFVNTSYHPLRDAEGHIYGILDFSYDVTAQVLARRQVEQLNHELETRVQQRTQALAGQRQQLRQILAQVPAAIATLDGPEHRFAFANDIYRTLVGNRAALGQPTAEAQPELVAQGFIDLLDRVYTTGEPYLGREIPVQLHDATSQQAQTLYVDFSYQPLRNAQGEITGILVFAVDETEKVLARRQADTLQTAMLAVAQRQAREREELFQTFEQAPAAIMLLREPDHRIEYTNPAYQQFFPGQALQGHRLAEAHPNAAASGALARLDRVYQSGETYVGREEPVLLTLQEGQPPQIRYFNFTYQPYLANGQTVGVSVYATDATEQALARQQVHHLNAELATINHTLQLTNAELHQSNTHLTRTNVDLDTFVYMASHDLKAPITNIEGLLMALHDVLPAQVQREETTAQILQLLQGAIERFKLTIDQLTDISRLQQAQNLPAEQVPLGPLVANVRLDLLPQLTAADVQLTVDIAPDSQVLFAPKNLRSVVYNLLSNAIKYRATDRVPVISLRATREPDAVVLTVQDNGLGLSAAQQRQLFGLFQRLHTHVEGTGVGLYMVKRMVENAGGAITVQSQEGVGTTFTVTFRA
jgi:signal transduction histidine kinase